jgi:hypothetical protein
MDRRHWHVIGLRVARHADMSRFTFLLLTLAIAGCSVGSAGESDNALAGVGPSAETSVDVISCTSLVANPASPGATRREVLTLQLVQAEGSTISGVVQLMSTDSEQREGPTYTVEGTEPEFRPDYFRQPIVFKNLDPEGADFIIYHARDGVELVFDGLRVSVREDDISVQDAKQGSLFARHDRPKCLINRRALGYSAQQ